MYTEVTDEMLSYIDVLVDGEFVEELKDTALEISRQSQPEDSGTCKTAVNVNKEGDLIMNSAYEKLTDCYESVKGELSFQTKSSAGTWFRTR